MVRGRLRKLRPDAKGNAGDDTKSSKIWLPLTPFGVSRIRHGAAPSPRGTFQLIILTEIIGTTNNQI